MAIITVGTGATINAPTIEGQLFQLIHWVNNAESTAGGNESKFSLTKGEDGLLESTFTLDGQLTHTLAAGTVTESPLPYLTSTAFNAGNPLGTIKGTTFSQYFIDCCLYAIVWQRQTNTKNPQKLTGVTLEFDFAEARYSGKVSLPYASIIGAGGIVSETAIEWLVT